MSDTELFSIFSKRNLQTSEREPSEARGWLRRRKGGLLLGQLTSRRRLCAYTHTSVTSHRTAPHRISFHLHPHPHPTVCCSSLPVSIASLQLNSVEPCLLLALASVALVCAPLSAPPLANILVLSTYLLSCLTCGVATEQTTSSSSSSSLYNKTKIKTTNRRDGGQPAAFAPGKAGPEDAASPSSPPYAIGQRALRPPADSNELFRCRCYCCFCFCFCYSPSQWLHQPSAHAARQSQQEQSPARGNRAAQRIRECDEVDSLVAWEVCAGLSERLAGEESPQSPPLCVWRRRRRPNIYTGRERGTQKQQ